ncbi:MULTISPECIES: hypothetical protein [unclassified Streptomyces]|nr:MULTISPECIES: hypothetical protein [unclassified Streptomyces]WSR22440.1 hypothetical protein OG573_27145 [Streptomyces sp. NBC_01205]
MTGRLSPPAPPRRYVGKAARLLTFVGITGALICHRRPARQT